MKTIVAVKKFTLTPNNDKTPNEAVNVNTICNKTINVKYQAPLLSTFFQLKLVYFWIRKLFIVEDDDELDKLGRIRLASFILVGEIINEMSIVSQKNAILTRT